MNFVDNKLSLSQNSDAAATKNAHFPGKKMPLPFYSTVERLLLECCGNSADSI